MSLQNDPHLSGTQRQHVLAVCVSLAAVLVAGCSAGSPVFDYQGAKDANAESTTQSTSENPGIGAGTAESAETTQTESSTADTTGGSEQVDNGQAGTGGEDTQITDGPIACGSIDLGERLSILELINETRATGRQCGSDWFAATTPVTWNDQLEAAAAVHSTDLATHDIFSHTGTDGSSVSDRATTQGYEWNRIGENIAAGQPSFQTAMQGWIDSPGHCRNLMQPDFSNVAIACVTDTNSSYGNYWTQVFGNEF